VAAPARGYLIVGAGARRSPRPSKMSPPLADALTRRDWPGRLLMPLPAAESVVVRVTLVG